MESFSFFRQPDKHASDWIKDHNSLSSLNKVNENGIHISCLLPSIMKYNNVIKPSTRINVHVYGVFQKGLWNCVTLFCGLSSLIHEMECDDRLKINHHSFFNTGPFSYERINQTFKITPFNCPSSSTFLT